MPRSAFPAPSPASRPLAIDVGASKLEYAVADAKEKGGAKTGRVEIPGKINSSQLLRIIVTICKKSKATSLGIGFPGFVHQGKVLRLPNLPLVRPFHAKSVLERELGIPVSAENDVKCMALAIWHARGRKEDDDFIVIAPGSGIGGAIVRAGRLVRGKRSMAGEFGHMKILLAGEKNVSRAKNTPKSKSAAGTREEEWAKSVPALKEEEWEKLCGGFGIARQYELALKEERRIKTNRRIRAARPFAALPARERDARHILHATDPLARKISSRSAAYFGLGLALIASALEPKEFIIAGSVGAAYMGPLKKEMMRAFVANASAPAGKIPVSSCPIPNPALSGAALLSYYGM